jgi:hypothetical protein
MRLLRRSREAMAACAMLVALLLSESAGGMELTGAWAPEASNCSQVFGRKGRARLVGFTASSDARAGGFIVDGDRLRGKLVQCRIKTRKQDGQNLNLIAACGSDAVRSNIQFVLKVVDDDSLIRMFPGIEGMEMRYHRCRI